jgi:hypothetical protein
VVEYLPSKCEALSSSPTTAKKKKFILVHSSGGGVQKHVAPAFAWVVVRAPCYLYHGGAVQKGSRLVEE